MTSRKPSGDAASSRLSGLLADTDPYLSCDECFDRLDEYVERLLVDPEHRDVAMGTHLLACSACADEADSLLELITLGG